MASTEKNKVKLPPLVAYLDAINFSVSATSLVLAANNAKWSLAA